MTNSSTQKRTARQKKVFSLLVLLLGLCSYAACGMPPSPLEQLQIPADKRLMSLSEEEKTKLLSATNRSNPDIQSPEDMCHFNSIFVGSSDCQKNYDACIKSYKQAQEQETGPNHAPLRTDFSQCSYKVSEWKKCMGLLFKLKQQIYEQSRSYTCDNLPTSAEHQRIIDDTKEKINACQPLLQRCT